MKYIAILLIALLIGCASKDKVTVTYGEWKTDRFIVAAVTEGNQVDLSIFQNGKIKHIKVVNDVISKTKPGEEVTITYRRVEKIICTDHNCTMEESYEIKL